MSRFSEFTKRAHAVYRITAVLDAFEAASHEAVSLLALEVDDQAKAACEELKKAMVAVLAARSKLELALKAKALTAQNREAAYWSAGDEHR